MVLYPPMSDAMVSTYFLVHHKAGTSRAFFVTTLRCTIVYNLPLFICRLRTTKQVELTAGAVGFTEELGFLFVGVLTLFSFLGSYSSNLQVTSSLSALPNWAQSPPRTPVAFDANYETGSYGTLEVGKQQCHDVCGLGTS